MALSLLKKRARACLDSVPPRVPPLSLGPSAFDDLFEGLAEIRELWVFRKHLARSKGPEQPFNQTEPMNKADQQTKHRIIDMIDTNYVIISCSSCETRHFTRGAPCFHKTIIYLHHKKIIT